MNRLNFTQIVNKNLHGQQENKFFNITQLQSSDFYENQHYTAKIREAHERLNLEGKINDIVFHVHEKLRERQSSPEKIKHKPSKKKSLEKTKPKPKDIEREKLTIPRLKVLRDEKHQQFNHNSTMTTLNTISYEDHQRMLKAVKRQKVLENMLQDQKNIQQDRRCIAQDIFAMRHCLDDLHHRIDCSLKKLDTKKTYCECHDIRKGRNCKKCLKRGSEDILMKGKVPIKSNELQLL